MSVPAKYGAMLNIKIAGEISLSGVNIGDGYDYTNGGAFMTVVYEVKGGGSTSPSYHWEVACRASDSKNLIDKRVSLRAVLSLAHLIKIRLPTKN